MIDLLNKVLEIVKILGYITSYYGLTGSKNVNIKNVKKMIKRVRKYSKEIPTAVGFGVKTPLK